MRCYPFLSALFALLAVAAPASALQDWRLPPPVEQGTEIGCEFPDFPLPDTRGNMVWFNDYKGKVLMVSFCSCYTDTCCSLIDALEEIKVGHQGNLLTVMVCCETAPAMQKNEFQLLRTQCREAADVVLIDKLGETIEPFRVDVLPTTYLIDGEFCVRRKAVAVSELNTVEFREELNRALEEYPALRPE